jgi:hypothetical protein
LFSFPRVPTCVQCSAPITGARSGWVRGLRHLLPYLISLSITGGTTEILGTVRYPPFLSWQPPTEDSCLAHSEDWEFDVPASDHPPSNFPVRYPYPEPVWSERPQIVYFRSLTLPLPVPPPPATPEETTSPAQNCSAAMVSQFLQSAEIAIEERRVFEEQRQSLDEQRAHEEQTANRKASEERRALEEQPAFKCYVDKRDPFEQGPVSGLCSLG